MLITDHIKNTKIIIMKHIISCEYNPSWKANQNMYLKYVEGTVIDINLVF